MEWEVVHDYTETIEGLVAFRGSKYVQSRIGKTFIQTEAFLKQGREVLFSGTPCQIAGLKHFLRKEYDNLLAVDVICHGAPSPKIWQEYLEGETTDIRIKKSDITDISFRDKSTGWSSYSYLMTYNKDNTSVTHKELASKNLFMRGFLAHLYLRPSCHTCPAKDLKSCSDITLGDFWGIAQVIPGLDDDKGVGLILLNSVKGVHTFDTLPNMTCMESTVEIVRKYNPAYHSSSNMHPKREMFYSLCSIGKSISELVIMFTAIPFHKRVKTYFSKVLKKVLPVGTVKLIKKKRNG